MIPLQFSRIFTFSSLNLVFHPRRTDLFTHLVSSGVKGVSFYSYNIQSLELLRILLLSIRWPNNSFLFSLSHTHYPSLMCLSLSVCSHIKVDFRVGLGLVSRDLVCVFQIGVVTGWNSVSSTRKYECGQSVTNHTPAPTSTIVIWGSVKVDRHRPVSLIGGFRKGDFF